MRLVVLCNYKQSGGILVYPVHYSGAQNAVYSAEAVKSVQQCVYQRAFGIAVARVDGHALRLVHNGNVAVLVDYVKRNIFGIGGILLGVGQGCPYNVARGNGLRGLCRLAVY